MIAAALIIASLFGFKHSAHDTARANLPAAATKETITVGGSQIEITIGAGPMTLTRPALINWVRRSANSVSCYFGHFPTARASIEITPRFGKGFGFATTDSEGDKGVIAIPVGAATTQADLDKDWVLTHEMVHLGFPLVYPKDRWLVEGMATYIEPLARMQAGYLPNERVWADLVEGLPQGMPNAGGEGDRGLNNTQSWGRTYWGGALFCLIADLEIRKATANQKGLQDALRKIDSTEGDITSDMDAEDALRLGDTGIGKDSHILINLYNKMSYKAYAPDLQKLWKELGVVKKDNSVSFDDNAPMAAARLAIDAGK